MNDALRELWEALKFSISEIMPLIIGVSAGVLATLLLNSIN